MGMHNLPRTRGLVAVRVEQNSAEQIFTELRQAVEAMKEAHKKDLDDLKKGMGDVVQTEKVDRINNEITKLQTALDETNRMLAAVRIGGSVVNIDPEKKAHAAAFDQFFRKGVDAGLRDLEVKAAGRSDSDPDGGYLVPTQEEQSIDRILSTVSVMRSISSVMSISAASYKKLVGVGGATSGWVGEREARPETKNPQLVGLDFPAMELYANPAATQTLLDDARLDIGQWLGSEVSISFAEAEGAAFISGNGVNKPRGLGSYNMVADAQYAWGKLGFFLSGVAGALSDNNNNGIDALLSLVYGIKQGYRNNARFLMNRATQGAVRKLKDAEGRYHWQPPVQADQPATLLGYPVADDDNVQDIGAGAFPIWFGDFQRGYLIVDRAGVRVLRDPYTNKPYVHFYTTKRVGGGVQNFEAIKALKIAAV